MGNCSSCDCDGNGEKKVEFTISKVGCVLDSCLSRMAASLRIALVTTGSIIVIPIISKEDKRNKAI